VGQKETGRDILVEGKSCVVQNNKEMVSEVKKWSEILPNQREIVRPQGGKSQKRKDDFQRGGLVEEGELQFDGSIANQMEGKRRGGSLIRPRKGQSVSLMD